MKKEKLLILILLGINLLAIIYIKPIIAPFFGMKIGWQILYIISLYGYPVLLLIPCAVLMLPVAAIWGRGGNFKEKFTILLRRSFLIISFLVLLLNSIMVLSKAVLKREIFPLVKYADIEGTDADLSDLKTGKFQIEGYGRIERSGNRQREITTNNKDTFLFDLTWISPNEYRLINIGKSGPEGDTVYVRVSNNTPGYYECYRKYGDYGHHFKVEKISTEVNQ